MKTHPEDLTVLCQIKLVCQELKCHKDRRLNFIGNLLVVRHSALSCTDICCLRHDAILMNRGRTHFGSLKFTIKLNNYTDSWKKRSSQIFHVPFSYENYYFSLKSSPNTQPLYTISNRQIKILISPISVLHYECSCLFIITLILLGCKRA